MKIITEAAIYSPLPQFDFIAFDDSIAPDGPVGHGRTPIDALVDLYWQVDGETEAAVKIKMDIMEGNFDA